MKKTTRLSNDLVNSPFPEVDFQQWRVRVEDELQGEDFDRVLVTSLAEGISVQPLYSRRFPISTEERVTPLDLRDSAPAGAFEPGAADRSNCWQICQVLTSGGPGELNTAIRRALQGGATGIGLHFDRAARRGLDSNGSQVVAGEEGIAVYSLSDLEQALDGLPTLPGLWLLQPGANALPAASLFLGWVMDRPSAERASQLLLGADPLGSVARDGGPPHPLDASLEEMVALAAHCAAVLPSARAVMVSTEPYHSAGAHAAFELGAAIATAAAYLRHMERGGMSLEEAAAQIAFTFAIGQDLFLEIAKLGAARLLWRLLLRACGLTRVPTTWLHAGTAVRSLSRLDPRVNLLRSTTATFAAVIGGADSIATSSYDACLAEESEDGRRLARNTQLILAEESHLGRVIAPGHGCHYLESLTSGLARTGWEHLREIEAAGGMGEVLSSGWLRDRLDELWQERRRRLARRQELMTGVSSSADPSADSSTRPDSVPKVVLPAQRTADGASKGASPSSARREIDCRAIIEAARRGATLRDLTALVAVPRSARPLAALARHRDSEDFESLRAAADRLAVAGRRPTVYLACLEPVAALRREIELAVDVFHAGGLAVVFDETAEPPAELTTGHERACAEAEAQVGCICGIGATDADLVARVTASLRRAGALAVLAVISNQEDLGAHKTLGLDGLIAPGCDAVEILKGLLGLCGADYSEAGG